VFDREGIPGILAIGKKVIAVKKEGLEGLHWRVVMQVSSEGV
jgi:hypothetical protein